MPTSSPATTRSTASHSISRRQFLHSTQRALTHSAVAAAGVAPLFVRTYAHGAGPNDRVVLAAIGVGGQGRGDLNSFLGFDQVQVVAVCDVVGRHAARAKEMVDTRYSTSDCQVTADFRSLTTRADVDAVMIATPDHWHALIALDAMRHGKDVYCEKPETLTIREGQVLLQTARRLGRVFSGGSQRVWEDYQWFHRLVRSGALGEVKQAWVNVGEPPGPCTLPAQELPADVQWDQWLGPAPWRPFHSTLIQGGFRPYRDYSGGGMTDWGCHTFGGAMFALNLHETGPTEIIPPDGQTHPQLTFRFANGVEIYHRGGWDGLLNFAGSLGRVSEKDRSSSTWPTPDIEIPNYRGNGGIFGDFLHCVKTRQRPFRDIEVAHRTATLCHLGNIAYRLGQPLRWNPATETFVNDPAAERWLDRPRREPWNWI